MANPLPGVSMAAGVGLPHSQASAEVGVETVVGAVASAGIAATPRQNMRPAMTVAMNFLITYLSDGQGPEVALVIEFTPRCLQWQVCHPSGWTVLR